MIEATIIEQLDAMAQVAIKPEDLPRWEKTKEELLKKLGAGKMQEEANAALKQLTGYTGSDFVFERSEAPVVPGTIVYFQLGDLTVPIPAYVNARHEYSGKWKYDLIIAVRMPDAWHTTRIYNVESRWLTQI